MQMMTLNAMILKKQKIGCIWQRYSWMQLKHMASLACILVPTIHHRLMLTICLPKCFGKIMFIYTPAVRCMQTKVSYSRILILGFKNAVKKSCSWRRWGSYSFRNISISAHTFLFFICLRRQFAITKPFPNQHAYGRCNIYDFQVPASHF